MVKKVAKKKKSKKQQEKEAVAEAADYAALMKEATMEPSSYKISDLYETGTIISHSKFGRGVVKESYQKESKMTVLFEKGARTLAQGR